jgi:hypothetical protein
LVVFVVFVFVVVVVIVVIVISFIVVVALDLVASATVLRKRLGIKLEISHSLYISFSMFEREFDLSMLVFLFFRSKVASFAEKGKHNGLAMIRRRGKHEEPTRH